MLWSGVIEKREQIQTTTGPVVMIDDAFKTVTEQSFYGIRTGVSPTGIWTVGNATSGTLVEIEDGNDDEG